MVSFSIQPLQEPSARFLNSVPGPWHLFRTPSLVSPFYNSSVSTQLGISIFLSHYNRLFSTPQVFSLKISISCYQKIKMYEKMNKSVSMILSLSMKYRFQLEYSPPKTRYEPRGGRHLGIFWVGTYRRDSKLAPRSKKKFPWNWYPVLEMGQFFISRSRTRSKTDTPF